jgi:hypothetical protein
VRLRALARVLAVAGAAAVGAFLFRSWPREVTLVYDLGGRPAPAVEVEIRRGGETLRFARIRLEPGPGPVHHPVRLPDGDYEIVARIEWPGGPVLVSRSFRVDGEGAVPLRLAP